MAKRRRREAREEGRHILDLVEKYAPPSYDYLTDDMTVQFAILLAEKDTKIARLQDAKRAALTIADDRSRKNVELRAALRIARRWMPLAPLEQEAKDEVAAVEHALQ